VKKISSVDTKKIYLWPTLKSGPVSKVACRVNSANIALGLRVYKVHALGKTLQS